ncbi:MAG: hypothetical protein ABR974_05060 [Bacteroidales bacterium]|jgi:hypothetical protein
MKIVGIGNCRNLRNYVDEIVMRNLSKGKSKFYYNTVKDYIYIAIKRKLIREDYLLIEPHPIYKSEMNEIINNIMKDFRMSYLRKEKVKKIQYKLKNKELRSKQQLNKDYPKRY